FMNTKGITLTEFDTVFRLEGAVRSPGLDIELHEVIEDRSFASVASLPFGASMARRLKALEGEPVPVDGPMRVMMPPRVTAAIFALLAPHFTLKALQEESSFLAQARQGGAAFDTKVHLLDDGRVTGALRTTSFDDRGVSPVPLTLIRDGVVSASYKGLVEARQRNQRASGHRRGEDLHPTNLLVRGGTRTMNALLSEQSGLVLRLDHIRGLQRGLDIETGEIKVEASGVLFHGRQKVIGVVPMVRLTGNLVNVLRSVVELASDTDRFGHVDAPGMMVDGFTCKSR
ncbi:MAG: putative Zn-dependent protease, partial [Kiritimatiellia bacterium]